VRRTAALVEVVLALSALLASAARAEPAPTWLYADPAAGTCGELWGGDEYLIREPASPSFRRLSDVSLSDPALCRRALAAMPAAKAEGGDPCHSLRRLLDLGYPGKDGAAVCAALGYRFIGALPFIDQPGPAVRAERRFRAQDRLLRAAAVGVAIVLALVVVLLVRRASGARRAPPN